MKTKSVKTWIMAQSLLGLLITSQAVVYAQDDLLFETDNVLESEQLNIDGYYSEKPKKTAADRMADMRRKLEDRNGQMVDKKIEDIRIKEEAKLTKQLQRAFTDGMNNLDTVSNKQAATQKVEAPAPEPKAQKANKIVPTFGILNVKGTEVDFESKLNMGLSFETMVSSNFAAGFGLNYATMEIIDYNNAQFSNNYYYGNFNNSYNSFYGNNGREMSYDRLQMEVTGKYYFTVENKIRPFLSAGLSYNRSGLEYNDDGQGYSYQGTQFGGEGYSSSYISATAMFGSEVVLSENFGAQLDFRYNKGLTGGFNSKSNTNGFQNPDQKRLEDIGQAIEEADFFSINAGIVFMF